MTRGENLSVEERIRYEIDGISPRRQAVDRALRRATFVGARTVGAHWLLLFNAATGLTLVGAVAAAYLAAEGQRHAADLIYQTYLLLCPQRPSHSFFLWGQKVALEQRVLAIYAALFVAGLFYSRVRGRLPRPHWRLVVVLSLPMLVDVLSQTVGWRESDWFWRTTTGSAFGLVVSSWGLPHIDIKVRQMLGPR